MKITQKDVLENLSTYCLNMSTKDGIKYFNVSYWYNVNTDNDTDVYEFNVRASPIGSGGDVTFTYFIPCEGKEFEWAVNGICIDFADASEELIRYAEAGRWPVNRTGD